MTSNNLYHKYYKITDVFNLNQGHQITEEEIYNDMGNIPIYTGQNKLVGYVSEPIVRDDDLPCISYPTKGQVGEMYIKKEHFNANNTAILIPKKKFRGKINLAWFISVMKQKIKRESNSKFGVGYIGKELMNRVSFYLPSKEVQDSIAKSYSKCLKLKSETVNNIQVCNEYLEQKIEYQPKFTEIISRIFDVYGGNSGLKEEFIYNNLPLSNKDAVEVYSGATLSENRLGRVAKNAILPNGKKLKLFQEKSILVSRKGKAGSMTHMTDDIYTINDDAYVLIPKSKWKDKINIEWFTYQYQPLFLNIATSKSDNATFNKKWLYRVKVQTPEISMQNDIMQNISAIKQLIEKLKITDNKLTELLDHTIT
ncbi:MAG: restriction endonuclease subunit S [Nanoarchaeota archaeon]|nr:restriction endonuclease subunit S [Nanoarchaeota archaeon]